MWKNFKNTGNAGNTILLNESEETVGEKILGETRESTYPRARWRALLRFHHTQVQNGFAEIYIQVFSVHLRSVSIIQDLVTSALSEILRNPDTARQPYYVNLANTPISSGILPLLIRIT